MERTPNAFAHFLPAYGVIPNPDIGFSSFQHFRAEPLFGAEADGWQKEYWPVRPDVPQTGACDGFHPDTQIAYIRFCWRDFEPGEGEYDFAMVESLLDAAQRHGQTLMLRLMPHTTRPDQDIPDWLAARIPHPERPAHERVKASPTHPEFYRCFARAGRALGTRFDGDARLCCVDTALCGAWGEGHDVDLLPEPYARMLLEAWTQSFRTTPLVCPVAGSRLLETPDAAAHVGLRADCLGDMNHHMYWYPRVLSRFPQRWKTAPMSFESCWTLLHWYRQGWDIDYIAEQSLKWHISHFNAKSSPCPRAWESAVDAWLQRMGYRFALRRIEYPQEAAPGDTLTLGMWMENRGVAPIYRRLPFRLRLRGAGRQYVLPTDVDIRRWLPGDTMEQLRVTLPDTAAPGAYLLEAGIGEGSAASPTVRMAMQAPGDGQWWELGRMQITDAVRE